MERTEPAARDVREGTEHKRRPSSTRRWKRIGLVLAVALALVQPTARVLGRYDWRLDLISHFQGPALAYTVALWGVLVRRSPRLSMGLLVLGLIQAEPLVRYNQPNPVRPDLNSTARLRLLMANVLCENESYGGLARLIEDENPDVVGLVEVTPQWIEALAGVRARYPYRIESAEGAKGLVLWFRSPPLSLDPPRRPVSGGWPYLHAMFDFGGRTRHLWLVHPSSPFRRMGVPELNALAEVIGSVPGSRIVMGDMNATDGSGLFSDFLARTELRDSRIGFGRALSWPVWSYVRISIDHVFVSNDLAVVTRRLGPDIGSDHFPVVVELAPGAVSPEISASK